MTTSAIAVSRRSPAALLPIVLPAICLIWAYWTTFVDLAHTWNNNPQYSHGFLVPIFAGFLLWFRRDKLQPEALKPSLWGVVLLAMGLAVKLGGSYAYFVSLDPLSFVPCVAGLVLLVGGWAAWRWAWPAVLFLSFMMPLPYFAAVMMSSQLQWIATITSTFVMQTMGLPALSEGNVILLNDHEIGIVEACSGLRMLVVFFALSTAVTLVIDRQWMDRMIILASAVPIALISNIIRVTATGIMYEAGYSEMASHFFHDVAGWLMMPLALGMLWIELKVLGALFIDTPRPQAARTPYTNRRAIPRPAVPRVRRTTGQSPRESTVRENNEIPQPQPIEQTH